MGYRRVAPCIAGRRSRRIQAQNRSIDFRTVRLSKILSANESEIPAGLHWQKIFGEFAPVIGVFR